MVRQSYGSSSAKVMLPVTITTSLQIEIFLKKYLTETIGELLYYLKLIYWGVAKWYGSGFWSRHS